MNIGVPWCLLLVASCTAEQWRWPETAASVRIDTKVRFVDTDSEKERDNERNNRRVQHDEAPFREPVETEGFYNRPPGSGRYPVRVESHHTYHVDGHGIYPLNNKENKNQFHDGTLDSLQYCKCETNPDCTPRPNSLGACGLGKFLCCYKRPSKVTPQNEFFNEVQDERLLLLPGQENLARPFPPPPGGPLSPENEHETAILGVFDKPQGVLVGPDGPTGAIGPQHKPAILVGPGGPTGIIGPGKNDERRSESAQSGVLVGPVGPTGLVGSYGRRSVLVGPGGPTGIIGPGRGNRGGPGLLVGPGGPTGIIGPAYGRQKGLLTGPGGPTGIIGPSRSILVGPGGPTGQIGPQGYFSK